MDSDLSCGGRQPVLHRAACRRIQHRLQIARTTCSGKNGSRSLRPLRRMCCRDCVHSLVQALGNRSTQMNATLRLASSIVLGLCTASYAQLSGRVTLSGTPPKMKQITAMATNPQCAQMHKDPVYEDTV